MGMKGNALQLVMVEPEEVPATLGTGAVEAEGEETVFEAIRCLGRTRKEIPGRKPWSSFLPLCPDETYTLAFLKEGV